MEVALQNSTAARQEVPTPPHPSTVPCAGRPTSTNPHGHSSTPRALSRLLSSPQLQRVGGSFPHPHSIALKKSHNKTYAQKKRRKHRVCVWGGGKNFPQTNTKPLKSPTSTGMGLAAVTPSTFAAQTTQHCCRGAWEWGT